MLEDGAPIKIFGLPRLGVSCWRAHTVEKKTAGVYGHGSIGNKYREKGTVRGIGGDGVGKRMRRTRSAFDSSVVLVAESRLRSLLVVLEELMRRTIWSPP